MLFALKLCPDIVPKPVVTAHAPVLPVPAATAWRFIVLLHTVWLSAVMIVASTALFNTVMLPVVVQPFLLADHWNVLGPLPKPLTLGLLVFAFVILIVPAPAVFVQFQTLLPVMFVPVMSWAVALKFALVVHTV